MDKEDLEEIDSASKQLWINESDAYIDVVKRPDETTLFFGIFYLDKWRDHDVKQKLEMTRAQLTELIGIWNRSYPWGNFEGIEVGIIENSDEKPFLFGSLCVERHQEAEERLVVCLLQKLSEQLDSSFFIKTCTSEGEFLLMECHDVLPSEYQYPMGNNRLWIHQGKFKFIPSDLAPRRGVRKQEALRFLTNEYFKLSENPSVTERIKKVTGLAYFPDSYVVDNLASLPLCLTDKALESKLRENPKAISLALNNIYMNGQDTKETVDISKLAGNESTVEFKVLISKAQEKFLAGFLRDSGIDLNSARLPSITGQIIAASLQDLVRNDELTLDSPSGSTPDILSSLKAKGLLNENYVTSGVDFVGALRRDDEITNEDAISRMQRLFSNIRMDMESGNAQETDEADNSSDDDDDDNLANTEAMNYFRDQNVDIDEDDFFEYFVTEALKLKQSDLEELRQKGNPGINSSPPNQEEREMLQELESLFGLGTKTDSGKFSDSVPADLLEARNSDPPA
ncbi:uncharacterized protein LALA0_S01e03598g [Lachancea lanzarotensis]|uniref:LALA0S01e03598g1_1 n=1 Tax=Lachancea lanzarotensis TaxID=1245769 RepID=A0A0C7MXD6_9SACH|nr:uncharacterized protein LALA0_S01e03598g [Lachancea lanzarotensis]CEP60125.1 LALA0S01e03598g1_1 [Lachancea lanzarotensis]